MDEDPNDPIMVPLFDDDVFGIDDHVDDDPHINTDHLVDDVQIDDGNCPHSNTVRVKISTNRIRDGLLTRCPECRAFPGLINGPENKTDTGDGDENEPDVLWLCCYCGDQLCGRYQQKHALQHHEKNPFEHSICINTTTKMAWCYKCDKQYMYSKLSEVGKIVDIISIKMNDTKLNKLNMDLNHDGKYDNNDGDDDNHQEKQDYQQEKYENNEKSAVTSAATSLSSSNNVLTISNIPTIEVASNFLATIPNATASTPKSRIRGLRNLGNTCFFNSVLQCLVQTPYLLPILKQSSKPGEEFNLRGGMIKDISLPSFTGKLKAWNTLTSTLAQTLEELQTPGGTYDPRKLFDTFVNCQPQFGGGDQHDSHELLRHLLDAVRNDDVKRYKMQILKFIQYDKSENYSEHEKDELNAKCKFYGAQINERILIPEHVFRGFLVSTLKCEDCDHTSPCHESFLDISLPVNINRSRMSSAASASTSANARPKNAQSPSPPRQTNSKKDRKKAREEKKLERKALKKQQKMVKETTVVDESRQHTAEYFMKTQQQQARTQSSSSDASDSESKDLSNMSISGYDSNGNKEVNVLDHKQATKLNGMYKKSQLNNSLDDDDDGDADIDDDDDDDDDAIANSKNTESSNACQNELVSVSISDEGKAKLIEQQHDNRKTGQSLTGGHKISRTRTKSFTDCSTTIAPPYIAKDDECSIQSCLQNFTEVEHLSDNNKVGCDKCTEVIYSKNNAGRTYYTNQTKQLLVSSPPAVMILHLKRFHVGMRGTFHKLSDRITFPLILDMAPFCASAVKYGTNVKRHQTKIVYSLYGVVEHSGSMHGGHYIAYVKVRSPVTDTDPRWKFIPKNSKDSQIDEQKTRLDANIAKERERELARTKHSKDDSDDATSSSSSSSDDEEPLNEPNDEELKPPPGKWYYASDSSVSEVDEKRVLHAQAYLLFYERIY